MNRRNSRAQPPSAPPMPGSVHDGPAPSALLLALEMRAFWEFGAVLPAWPALQRAPAGDGHAVIVFPGLSASDGSTVPLRRYLKGLGHQVDGWNQGFNFGPRAGVLEAAKRQLSDAADATGRRVSLIGWNQGFNFGPRAGVLEAAKRQLSDAADATGRRVSLIGWSLGGVYARELAKALPDLVRGVVTLGTPFAGSPKSTNAWRLYELTSGRKIDREAEHFDLPGAPPVPTTSIYSRTDGVVAWQGSVQAPCPRNPHTENVEVIASHFGIGLNPSAWWAVADRLGQPEGQWKPFERKPGLHGLIFPDPSR